MITRATGKPALAYTSLVLTAWRGEESQALALIRAGLDDATSRGEGRAITLAEYATAVLYNGLGHYQAALAAAQRASEHDDLGLYGWALIELVEAGSRTGERELAAAAAHRLDDRAHASGTDWALGIAARSRALLSEDDAAEGLYREAIERLARSRIAVHLARTRLLYGEWLRRENRRLDAREQLRGAHDTFSGIGAAAFAERARRELSPQVGPYVHVSSERSSSSRCRRRRSPGWPAMDLPIRRSAPGCSSALAPSSGTSARSSQSLASPRAEG